MANRNEMRVAGSTTVTNVAVLVHKRESFAFDRVM